MFRLPAFVWVAAFVGALWLPLVYHHYEEHATLNPYQLSIALFEAINVVVRAGPWRPSRARPLSAARRCAGGSCPSSSTSGTSRRRCASSRDGAGTAAGPRRLRGADRRCRYKRYPGQLPTPMVLMQWLSPAEALSTKTWVCRGAGAVRRRRLRGAHRRPSGAPTRSWTPRTATPPPLGSGSTRATVSPRCSPRCSSGAAARAHHAGPSLTAAASVGMTWTVLPARALGVIGMLVHYQELYGTVIYFSTYFYNGRYKRQPLTNKGIVLFSNSLWIALPAVAMVASWELIATDSYDIFRQ